MADGWREGITASLRETSALQPARSARPRRPRLLNQYIAQLTLAGQWPLGVDAGRGLSPSAVAVTLDQALEVVCSSSQSTSQTSLQSPLQIHFNRASESSATSRVPSELCQGCSKRLRTKGCTKPLKPEPVRLGSANTMRPRAGCDQGCRSACTACVAAVPGAKRVAG